MYPSSTSTYCHMERYQRRLSMMYILFPHHPLYTRLFHNLDTLFLLHSDAYTLSHHLLPAPQHHLLPSPVHLPAALRAGFLPLELPLFLPALPELLLSLPVLRFLLRSVPRLLLLSALPPVLSPSPSLLFLPSELFFLYFPPPLQALPLPETLSPKRLSPKDLPPMHFPPRLPHTLAVLLLPPA